VNVNVTSQGHIIKSNREKDIVADKKQAIADKNEELYILQVKVLKNNYGENPITEEEREQIIEQCDALEHEILVLCREVRDATRECKEAEGFDTWKKKQAAATKDLKLLAASASREQAGLVAKKASAIEQQAATVVRELHARIARKDSEQFKVWRQARLSELQMLEQELAHARATGKDDATILAQLEETCEDLDRMVKAIQEDDESDSEDESDSDDDSEHEAVALFVGDKVRLRRAEDGLAVDELAVVTEVDSHPSSTYPYRVVACCRKNGKAANGFFKAGDLQLVQRAPSKEVKSPPVVKGDTVNNTAKSPKSAALSPKSLTGIIGNVRSISVTVNPLIIC